MAFHLEMGDGVEEGFRRIAIAQLERALRAADDPDARAAAPHAIRKRCKKLRGLLRLVRGSFDDYRVEQRALRDTARRLAALREAGAHLEALERLCARAPSRYQGPDFAAAGAWLESRRDAAMGGDQEHACVEEARAMLAAQRERVHEWTLRDTGFDAVADGLAGTYRSARQALSVACDDPTADHLHELRKHVKYQRYHFELLHKVWPRPMKAAMCEAEELGGLLGEHHDIDVLLAALAQDDAGPAINDAGDRIAAASRHERERLEGAALCLARRLLAEKPRCFGERLRGYWNAART